MRGILIDLDGVIWEGDKVVPGAATTLDWLRANKVPYLFVTNTTSRPRRLISDKLTRLGIANTAEQILTPPAAAMRWMRVHELELATLIVPSATHEDFAGLETVAADDPAKTPAAIIVGDIGQDWSFTTLNNAFRCLMQNPQPRLIALGMTRYWRNNEGLQLDVAPFIKALEHAADCTAVVVGKPGIDFFRLAAEMLNCKVSDTIMIGDDIKGDVGGAQQAGMTGILVKTGKFLPRDLESDIRPDAVLNSIAELPDWLNNTGIVPRPGGG